MSVKTDGNCATLAFLPGGYKYLLRRRKAPHFENPAQAGRLYHVRIVYVVARIMVKLQHKIILNFKFQSNISFQTWRPPPHTKRPANLLQLLKLFTKPLGLMGDSLLQISSFLLTDDLKSIGKSLNNYYSWI